jgi:hypothetical protein
LLPLPLEAELSPRSAAEELGFTFLPCVLVGLSRAPQFITQTILAPVHSSDVWADQIDAIVIPETACGGSAVMSLSQSPAKIIAVRENHTKMQVPPESLGINAISVNSYLEALGVLVCDRAGIDYKVLNPTIAPLRCLETDAVIESAIW